ncbi:hypothetical protein TorRG33x02_262820 [Trema orientale]|uniref:Uncharacterized protein n=1 Tax=Trema orientale TaxID=63057 RepID=A0A2P5D4A3_TREOI|nr:hypothetical protein TorRG33x02_262820 [Trema orientale]
MSRVCFPVQKTKFPFAWLKFPCCETLPTELQRLLNRSQSSESFPFVRRNRNFETVPMGFWTRLSPPFQCQGYLRHLLYLEHFLGKDWLKEAAPTNRRHQTILVE